MKDSAMEFLNREFPSHSRVYGEKDYDMEDVMLGWNEGIQEGRRLAREEMRCDSCIHWIKEEGNDFGECKKGIGDVGEYPQIDGCIGDGRQEDGTGCGRTGPKFGCIHWKSVNQVDKS